MIFFLKEEQVQIDSMLGHGGLFKTKGVGQKIMAAAIDAPVSVMETAGEGGAWGIALLAAYRKNREENEDLDSYLRRKYLQDSRAAALIRSRNWWRALIFLSSVIRRGFPSSGRQWNISPEDGLREKKSKN